MKPIYIPEERHAEGFSKLVESVRMQLTQSRGEIHDIERLFPGWSERVDFVVGTLTAAILSLHNAIEEYESVQARRLEQKKPSGRSDRAAMPSQAGLAGSADFATAPNSSNAGENVRPVPPADHVFINGHLTRAVTSICVSDEEKALIAGVIDPNAACRAAFARGERIEVRVWNQGNWYTCIKPHWYDDFEYRIAPTSS